MSKIKNQKTGQKERKIAFSSISKFNGYFSWIIFAFATLLFANTLTHDYTQDDAIVIYDNMYTTQGISGIPGLLKYDTFRGFFKTEGKAKLVSGGRYRPLTPIMFAIEYQIFGKNPFWGHLISVLLYGFLCMVIYKTLLLLLNQREGNNYTVETLAFIITLVFAVHPLHTEVVANIKGRDEIMSMMGGIAALFFCLKYIDNKKAIHLVFATIMMFLGLMSKENTITFLGVIPLAIFLFRRNGLKESITPFFSILSATIVFLIIRFQVLGMDFGGTPQELMNNPYLKIVGNKYIPFTGGEKLATIMFTLGKYIQLLIFPHPLTHDYYPRHIEIMTWGNWKVILSVLTYLVLGIYAVLNLKKRKEISFGIFYFIMTLSIVSNIVFPIGTNMSERFMFMPSLGFSIVLVYGMNFIFSKNGGKSMSILFGIIILLFSFKTIARNMVWKNDFTLFTTDVKTSPNSAKVLNAAGGALVAEASKKGNEAKKDKMLDDAIGYLNRALKIHPNYKNPSLIMGNAYYYKNNLENSIKSYEYALALDPNFVDAQKNLAVAYRDAGRKAGEQENNLEKAKNYLNKSIQLAPNDPDTYRLLAITYGIAGDHANAIKYFTKVIEMRPNDASAYVNLAKTYQYAGDENNSRLNYQKAMDIDPDAMNKY